MLLWLYRLCRFPRLLILLQRKLQLCHSLAEDRAEVTLILEGLSQAHRNSNRDLLLRQPVVVGKVVCQRLARSRKTHLQSLSRLQRLRMVARLQRAVLPKDQIHKALRSLKAREETLEVVKEGRTRALEGTMVAANKDQIRAWVETLAAVDKDRIKAWEGTPASADKIKA